CPRTPPRECPRLYRLPGCPSGGEYSRKVEPRPGEESVPFRHHHSMGSLDDARNAARSMLSELFRGGTSSMVSAAGPPPAGGGSPRTQAPNEFTIFAEFSYGGYEKKRGVVGMEGEGGK
uniref:Uncharacterized protein n=1 Tax=Anopheles albimanus TaxID=7167 RepID=A0A182FPW4_ANOAL